MTDELIKRVKADREIDAMGGNDRRRARVIEYENRILADANIIKAAEALARQFEIALCELRGPFADFPGVDYNCPDHNAAIAVYRAAMGARK